MLGGTGEGRTTHKQKMLDDVKQNRTGKKTAEKMNTTVKPKGRNRNSGGEGRGGQGEAFNLINAHRGP